MKNKRWLVIPLLFCFLVSIALAKNIQGILFPGAGQMQLPFGGTSTAVSDRTTLYVAADGKLHANTFGGTDIELGEAGAGGTIAHAASHTNGTDNIQNATAAQIGLATAAQITKLDGIETSADVTDATNVAAAGAVMDSDISEGEGFLRKTGVGAYEAIKSNLAASVAPTANEDSDDGYAVGSIWIDTTADKEYVLLDSTVASAVWTETTQSGTGNHAASHTDGSDDIQSATAAQKGVATAAQITKLDGIETSATADQTGAEIKTAYELEANTNAFTDAEQTKLTGIATSADVTSTTNVAASGAVMDTDISEGEGFLRKTGVGTYEAIKTNLAASVAPTANEDSDDGYAVGSRWIDTTADKEYVLLDSTVASAVWIETTQSGGGGGAVDTLVLDIANADITLGRPSADALSITGLASGKILTIDMSAAVNTLISTNHVNGFRFFDASSGTASFNIQIWSDTRIAIADNTTGVEHVDIGPAGAQVILRDDLNPDAIIFNTDMAKIVDGQMFGAGGASSTSDIDFAWGWTTDGTDNAQFGVVNSHYVFGPRQLVGDTTWGSVAYGHTETDHSVFFHSSTLSAVATDEWLGISHDTTDATISTGTGDLILAPAGVVQLERVNVGTGQVHHGTATPEGAVTAPVGSLFLRTDGGAATTLYVKETGTGNTGWVGK